MIKLLKHNYTHSFKHMNAKLKIVVVEQISKIDCESTGFAKISLNIENPHGLHNLKVQKKKNKQQQLSCIA